LCIMKLLVTVLSVSLAFSFPLYSSKLQQKPVKELNVNLSIPFVSTGAWIAPGRNDLRSPCPGLNVLANHGALPHSGSELSKDIVVNGISSVFNFSPLLAGTLFENAALNMGQRVIDLEMIRKHGLLEHDASLTRYDTGDSGKDNFTPRQELVNQLKSFAVNGYLDWTGIAKARLFRISQEQKSNPNFQNGLKESTLAIGECVFIIRVLGDGNRLPVEWMDSWFMKEQIPAGWKPPTSAFGALEIAADTLFFKGCIDKVSLGLSC
jgi:hypothetical protein